MRTIVNWGWSPILITAVAIAGYVFEWGLWAVAPALVVILVLGLVVAVVRGRERQLELLSLRLRQLAGYFNRRFAGNSPLSIFTIIDTLFSTEDSRLWDWARGCDMARRVFDTWCNSFIGRVESDTRTRRFDVYLRAYLNELWLINNHYYEFIEQFYEIAQSGDMPRETVDQYERFAVEYNSFVETFRDSIAQLKKVAKTEIEPPSAKLARELARVK